MGARAVVVQPSFFSPMIDPPDFLPTQRDEKRVFLEPEKWVELEDVADFTNEAYEELKIKGALSRNDVIERLLIWGLEAFWDERGGRPKTITERKKKVAEYAAWLKRKLAEKEQAALAEKLLAHKSNDGQSR